MVLDICAEALIRLTFEILKYGLDHLGFVIFLSILLMFRKAGLFIIAGIGALIGILDFFTLISGPFAIVIAPLIGTATFLSMAWVFAMMVVASEGEWYLKVISVVPIAILGAIAESLIGLAGFDIGLTVAVAFLLSSRNLANIFLGVVSGGMIFLIVVGNDTICSALNTMLELIKDLRQEGVGSMIGNFFSRIF